MNCMYCRKEVSELDNEVCNECLNEINQRSFTMNERLNEEGKMQEGQRNKGMKIYIAGKITGQENYKELFKKVEDRLTKKGNNIMNPSVLPKGFEHHEYIRVCFAMIDVCEVVYFLNNWQDSRGAKMEHEYAVRNGKFIMFEPEDELLRGE